MKYRAQNLLTATHCIIHLVNKEAAKLLNLYFKLKKTM